MGKKNKLSQIKKNESELGEKFSKNLNFEMILMFNFLNRFQKSKTINEKIKRRGDKSKI
jgi:hypothetical protein